MEEKSNESVAEKISEQLSGRTAASSKNKWHSSKFMAYVDVICVLTTIIVIEIMLGIMIFKQMPALLLVVMVLNILMSFFASDLHMYFLVGIGAVELIAGGLTQHTIVAVIGTLLFTAFCFALRKFLKRQ